VVQHGFGIFDKTGSQCYNAGTMVGNLSQFAPNGFQTQYLKHGLTTRSLPWSYDAIEVLWLGWTTKTITKS
jgi:hypothetical protein